MPSFSSIGEQAIGELADPTGKVRLPDMLLALDSEAPAIAGGGSVAHPGAALSLVSSPPVMDVGAKIVLVTAGLTLAGHALRVAGGGSARLVTAGVELVSAAHHVAGGGRVALDGAGMTLSSDPPQIVRLARVRLRSAMTRLTSDPPRTSPGGVVQAWMMDRLFAGVSIAEVSIGEAGPSTIRDATPPLRLSASAPVVSGGGALQLPGPALLVLLSHAVTPVVRPRVPTILAIAS